MLQPAAPAAPPAQAANDPILTAMGIELDRARRSSFLGYLPYHFEFSVDDAQAFGVSATLGALFPSRSARLRPLRAHARVGSAQTDSANSIFSDLFSGTRYDSLSLPVDNSVPALRHSLWLTADRTFKTAVDAFGRKQAALRGVNVSQPLPDFWPAQPLNLVAPQVKVQVDEALWTARVRDLSAIFLAHPNITASGVEFDTTFGDYYYMNTAGSVVRVPDGIITLRARASRLASDGSVVYDGVSLQAASPSAMPDEGAQRAAVQTLARNLDAVAAAPLGEVYSGPVLFEAQAAGQIVAELLGSQAGPTRRPVSEPGRAIPFQASEFEGRMGARVLPEWMDLTDDATRKEYNGRPLIGYYQADLEGVAPSAVKIVEKGMLADFLTTRTPVTGGKGTNGHARLPGAFGMKVAKPGNLFLTVSQNTPDSGMKAKLIELVKSRGKPYGMLVRKMDFPSMGGLADLRRLGRSIAQSGGNRLVSAPVLIYKVFPDGREELVRGVRFRAFSSRSFRDILAAGDRPAVFEYIENGAPLALTGAGNFIVGVSVVAPSLLFEELELDAAQEDRPVPPIVPPPLAPGS
jgi:hypothetical protein